MEFENHNLEYDAMYNINGISDGDSGDYEDAFYIELRRQILLLTAEDDEDESFHRVELSNSKRRPSRLPSYSSCATQRGRYFHLWEGENIDSAPSWLVNLWKRSGNGTGVFIPQIVNNSRRRYRPAGRTGNEKTRMYRPKKQY